MHVYSKICYLLDTFVSFKLRQFQLVILPSLVTNSNLFISEENLCLIKERLATDEVSLLLTFSRNNVLKLDGEVTC